MNSVFYSVSNTQDDLKEHGFKTSSGQSTAFVA